MRTQYRVTVDNQEYDVWRDEVRRVGKQKELAPEQIARVKAALRAQYEKKAAKVATRSLSTLRAQILKESKQPWLVGYDTYLRWCYGLHIDVAAGVVWQKFGDLRPYAIDLASYWHTRMRYDASASRTNSARESIAHSKS